MAVRYFIRSFGNPALYLDNSKGSGVSVEDFSGGSHQQWFIHRLSLKHGGAVRIVNIQQGWSLSAALVHGGAILEEPFPAHELPGKHVFTLDPEGPAHDTKYRIKSNNGNYLSVAEDSTAPGAQVVFWTYSNEKGQRWKIEEVAGGDGIHDEVAAKKELAVLQGRDNTVRGVIDRNHDALLALLVDHQMPPSTSELWGPVPRTVYFLPEGTELPGLDAYADCPRAVAEVLVEALLLVLSAWGLPTANTERLQRAVMNELGQPTLDGLQRSVHSMHTVYVVDEATVWEKLTALSAFVGESGVMPVLPRLVEYIKQDWKWWEWIWAAAVIGLQGTAWMASDGVAFAAELMLVLSNVGSLVAALKRAEQSCGKAELPPP